MAVIEGQEALKVNLSSNPLKGERFDVSHNNVRKLLHATITRAERPSEVLGYFMGPSFCRILGLGLSLAFIEYDC